MDAVTPYLYFGTVQSVFSPDNPQNVNRHQYEYLVVVTLALTSTAPCRCIMADPYGSLNAYQDTILTVGSRVFVMFPQGKSNNVGVIIGGTRYYGSATDSTLGVHLTRRFQEMVESFTKAGAWTMVSDAGPNLQVQKTKIVLDDASGDNITIDKAAKTITINCDTWNVNVAGNANITVQGTATIEGESIKLGADATEAVIKGDTFQTYFNSHIHTGNLGAPTTPPIVPMPASALSTKVSTE